MNPQVLAGVIVLASVVAWAGFLGFVTLGQRKEKEAAEGLFAPEEVLAGAAAVAGAPGYVRELAVPTPAPKRRAEEEVGDLSRRQFLNRVWGLSLLTFLGQFTLASVDFIWPRLRGGLGAKITAGEEKDLKTRWEAARDASQMFIPDGRFYIIPFEGDVEKAKKVPALVASNVPQTGWVALYRKCVHLGCSVPWCQPSKWFECPCHGSKYSVNGEYRDGPAPRGLDRFPVTIVNGQVIVDTGTVITGPPRGTFTSQPQPEGEHCVTIRAG
jgi:cytochrome b6-f complex iron-sulfur subunit